MSKNLANKLGKGIKPAAFIESMEKHKEAFLNWQEQFVWENEDDKKFFQSLQFRDDLRCLILAAEWCGDVVRNLPVVLRALEETGMPVEVLVMEDHLETMDEFLTMGGRAIPVVIFVDTGGFVLGTWGPRPQHVQAVMKAFKAANPDREAADYQEKLTAVRSEMLKQYGEGTGYQTVIVKELRDLLSDF